MANEIVAVNPAENLPVHNLQEMNWLANMLSGTQMFGQTNPADSLAIVAMCHQERMSWMRFSQTYHWIKGRPTKKTDAILADFAKAGGKKRIKSRTAELAECTFSLDGDEFTSRISWEDAQREPFVYEGKESDVLVALANGGRYPNGRPITLKGKYQTPRARMQMLWARCVSDGVRAVAPQCCCGIYTPEETDDFADTPRACAPSTVAAAPTSSPVPVQPTSVSPSPISDPNVCPAGTLKGRPWAEMDTPTLHAALEVPGNVFTDEMKNIIRGIISARETEARAAADNIDATEEE